SGLEFIRRFHLHLWPQGFTKNGDYGLLCNNRRKKRIALAQAALAHSELAFPPGKPNPPPPPILCPHCQGTNLRCLARIDSSGKWTLFTSTLRLKAPAYADTS